MIASISSSIRATSFASLLSQAVLRRLLSFCRSKPLAVLKARLRSLWPWSNLYSTLRIRGLFPFSAPPSSSGGPAQSLFRFGMINVIWWLAPLVTGSKKCSKSPGTCQGKSSTENHRSTDMHAPAREVKAGRGTWRGLEGLTSTVGHRLATFVAISESLRFCATAVTGPTWFRGKGRGKRSNVTGFQISCASLCAARGSASKIPAARPVLNLTRRRGNDPGHQKNANRACRLRLIQCKASYHCKAGLHCNHPCSACFVAPGMA